MVEAWKLDVQQLNSRLKKLYMVIRASVNVDVPDHEGSTPLLLASQVQSGSDILPCLLHNEAKDSLAQVDKKGRTALHHAAYETSFDNKIAIERLIDAGAPLNAFDFAGHTPLWYLSSWGRPDNIIPFVSAGADLDAAGAGTMTPLTEACIHNSEEMLKRFIENGADVNATAGSISPLINALKAQNTPSASGKVRILLEAGARIIVSVNGSSSPRELNFQPLVVAAKGLELPRTRALLDRVQGAEIDHDILDRAFYHVCVDDQSAGSLPGLPMLRQNRIDMDSSMCLTRLGANVSMCFRASAGRLDVVDGQNVVCVRRLQ